MYQELPVGQHGICCHAVHDGYRRAMADQPAAPAETGTQPDGDSGPGRWGQVMDWAGAVALVLLVVMAVDVVTDGRFISRRLRRRRGGEGDDSGDDG